MNIVEEVKTIIAKLDEIDNYNSSLPQKQSVLDEKTQDILHYIENNKISAFGCYRIFKELKKIRIERRKIKEDMDLLRVYDTNKNKILSSNNRKFLIQEICIVEKKLHTKYNNRQYSEEELKNIIK